MKKLLLASVMSLATFSAFADLAEYHEKVLCNSPEALRLKDGKGSCDILISQNTKVEKQVGCIGNVVEDINCTVVFLNKDGAGAALLKCGQGDISTPMLNKTMAMNFAHYDVAALITTSNGQKKIINDSSSHTYFGNSILTIFLEDNGQDLKGDVLLNLSEGDVTPLKNVTCSYF